MFLLAIHLHYKQDSRCGGPPALCDQVMLAELAARKVQGVSQSMEETEWPVSIAKYEALSGNLPLGDPTRFDRLV